MKDLTEDIKAYFLHYLALLVVLDLGVGLFYLLRFNHGYQAIVVLLTSLLYIIWGIVHHWLEGNLHLKIFLEYLLIALMVDLVILSLLFRA